MSDKHGQITNHLGAILRTLREEKGLTREWVAEHSDTGLRHLAAIELGQKNPSVDTLYRLIRCIGVSADQIFYAELSSKGTSLDEISRLAATCTEKQQKLILVLSKCYLNRKILNSTSNGVPLIWNASILFSANNAEWRLKFLVQAVLRFRL